MQGKWPGLLRGRGEDPSCLKEGMTSSLAETALPVIVRRVHRVGKRWKGNHAPVSESLAAD